jgi:hypothetical protein
MSRTGSVRGGIFAGSLKTDPRQLQNFRFRRVYLIAVSFELLRTTGCDLNPVAYMRDVLINNIADVFSENQQVLTKCF